jgi:hypothetical protein
MLSSIIALWGMILTFTQTHASYTETTRYLDYKNKAVGDYLYEHKVTKLKGSETNFEEKLTRRQAALLLKRLFKDYKWEAAMGWSRTCELKDIYNVATSIQSEIYEACKFGVMQWSNGNFYPNSKITKWEIFIILARLINNDGTISTIDQALPILDDKDIQINTDSARAIAKYDIERKDIYSYLMKVLDKVYQDKRIYEIYTNADKYAKWLPLDPYTSYNEFSTNSTPTNTTTRDTVQNTKVNTKIANKYDTIIDQYCTNKKLEQVTITEPVNLSRAEILSYAKKLYDSKDIERLWLLMERLTHGWWSGKAGWEINWLTKDEWMSIYDTFKLLADYYQQKMITIMGQSELILINNFNRNVYDNQTIPMAFISLVWGKNTMSQEQFDTLLFCSANIYYEPFLLYILAWWQDSKWNYSTAYTLIQMADKLEEIKPKNLDNQYKMGDLWKQYSNLHTKYIRYEDMWISDNEAWASKKIAEQYMQAKYPQFSDLIYGHTVYK